MNNQQISGHVYVLVNKKINGLVKIGFTNRNPKIRASELSNFTGVPGRWEVFKSWELIDANEWEKKIFSALGKHHDNGEFFKLSPEDAVKKIIAFLSYSGILNSENLTAQEKKNIEEIKKNEKKYFEETRVELAIKDWKKIEDNEFRVICSNLADLELMNSGYKDIKIFEDKVHRILEKINIFSLFASILLMYFYSFFFIFLHIAIGILSSFIGGKNEKFNTKKTKLSVQIFYKRRHDYFSDKELPYPFDDGSFWNREIYDLNYP